MNERLEKTWLSYDEASVLAEVDRRTIHRWWRAGILTEVRYTPSGRPLFNRQELMPQVAPRKVPE